MKSVLVLFLIVAVLLSGCSNKTKINGQIFLLSQNGQVIRLPLVDVYLCDLSELEPRIKEISKKYNDAAQAASIKATDEAIKNGIDGVSQSELRKFYYTTVLSHHLYDNIPYLESTLSDVDGKFSFTINDKRKYAIVAIPVNSRNSDADDYVWGVKIPQENKPEINIILSNQNGAKSPGQLLQ